MTPRHVPVHTAEIFRKDKLGPTVLVAELAGEENVAQTRRGRRREDGACTCCIVPSSSSLVCATFSVFLKLDPFCQKKTHTGRSLVRTIDRDKTIKPLLSKPASKLLCRNNRDQQMRHQREIAHKRRSVHGPSLLAHRRDAGVANNAMRVRVFNV